MEGQPVISSSPQIHARGSTRSVMWWVIAALIPAGVWSVVLFGLRPLLVILTATAAAVACEALLNALFKRPQTIGDLSAVVTGLLIAYNMPPHVPLFVPAAASVFAIAVVKWSFGGLGANWMNPALAGRVFVFFSWGKAMTQWTFPRVPGAADAVSGPTPLGSIIPGSLGEMSALLLIAGGLFLVILRIVDWEIPLAYLGSFAFLIWLFDGMQYGSGAFSGDVVFHLCSGGLMLGAWFMATDMVTTPLTRRGRLIFGLGCGFFTFVIRRFGNLPEGVSLAIIFMNILTPLIDRHVTPKRYGVSK
ncbi:MAG: Na+-transporting NADH:ubiquinone oxidoreductase subunit D [Spirochaetales bacterium]|nr:MAG: Na+-transporting NADH:ubiquinone oxidoreductase subunit D [Spirochaetales bacterium]